MNKKYITIFTIIGGVGMASGQVGLGGPHTGFPETASLGGCLPPRPLLLSPAGPPRAPLKPLQDRLRPCPLPCPCICSPNGAPSSDEDSWRCVAAFSSASRCLAAASLTASLHRSKVRSRVSAAQLTVRVVPVESADVLNIWTWVMEKGTKRWWLWVPCRT